MLEPIRVKVLKIRFKNGVKRVATIEHGPRRPSICEGCPAPCCQGMFKPVLTSEELLSRRFPASFSPPPLWLKAQLPDVDLIATLKMGEDGVCPYFDMETHKCKIWPNCPKACLAYDCREDPRPEIREFVKNRLKELRWHGGNGIH